jgi:hypothetical protein
MTTVWIVLVTLALAAVTLYLRRTPAVATPTPRKAVRPLSPARSAAPTRAPAAALPALEWDTPVVDIVHYGKHTPSARPATAVVADISEAQRARIRDRYLAARFPGVARTGADLLETERIIVAARLYFEERKSDRAIELLGLAAAQCPADESLPLAQLEIAFLAQEPALYVTLAASFHAAHPASTQWDEVARLGRAIAPGEALFGAADAPRDTDHYGPWPDMPNWIQAPWDLTAEVRATEFHQAMARQAA